MLFQYGEYPTTFMHDAHLIAWIVIVGIMYLFAIILLVRAGRAKTPITKWIFRAFSWFLWFYGVTNIMIILSIWSPSLNEFHFLQTVANFIGLVSLLLGVAVLEKYLVPKTHHILTIFAIIIIVIDFLFVLFFQDLYDISLTIATIGAPILLVTIIGLYFVLIRQSTGEIRSIAIRTLLGIACCGIGAILNNEHLLGAGLSIWTAPIVFGLGVVLLGTSLSISKET